MTVEISREDFEGAVEAVSEVVSEICPGVRVRPAEMTYTPWGGKPILICEILAAPGRSLLYRGTAAARAGWGAAREKALRDMHARGGWPMAFSGEEMRLRLRLEGIESFRDRARAVAHMQIRKTGELT